MAGLDASDVKGETDVKGREAPDPGIYHGIVNHVDDSQDKYDAVIVDLEVLAGERRISGRSPGEPVDQRGRSLRHMMFLEGEKGKDYGDKHLRFALAVGLIKPGEQKDVDWNEAVGRQLVFAVEKRAGKDKKTGEEREYTNVGNYGLDLWSVGNPEVADVPKDEAALKLMQGGGQAAGSGKNPYDDI